MRFKSALSRQKWFDLSPDGGYPLATGSGNLPVKTSPRPASSMTDSIQAQLAKLPSSTLAQALYNLSVRDDRATRMVERLLLPADQMAEVIRGRIDDMARSTHFISWREANAFSDELGEIIEDIQKEIPDPSTSMDLLDSFYGMDGAIAERCDDSGGELTMVFGIQASEAYLAVAAKSEEDDAQLTARILKLAEKNDYGLRDELLADFPNLLTDEGCRNLAELLLQPRGDDSPFSSIRLAEACAKKLKDAELFRRARSLSRHGLMNQDHLAIAEIHFANQQVERAQEELDHCGSHPNVDCRKENLQLRIWEKQGRRDEIRSLLREQFHRHPSEELLNRLTSMGTKKSALLEALSDQQKKADRFDAYAVGFLLKHGCRSQAESAVYKHADKIWGGDYINLQALSKTLVKARSSLAASIVLRALLTDILDQPRRKAYGHAARYYQALNQLAPSIDDWGAVRSHADFKTEFDTRHKRKHAFWAKVNPPS